jgi:hypothetical protein
MRPIPGLLMAAAVLVCASPCLALTTVPSSMVSNRVNLTDPDASLEATLDHFKDPTSSSTAGGLGAFISNLFGGGKKQDNVAPARQPNLRASLAQADQPAPANLTENAMLGLPNP